MTVRVPSSSKRSLSKRKPKITENEKRPDNKKSERDKIERKISPILYLENPKEKIKSNKNIENESTKASYKISWDLENDPEPITSIISFRECVGEGSFSKVYRARIKSSGL